MKVVNQLDERVWTSFVEKQPDGNIFHTPEMMQVFNKAKGYSATLWAIVDDDGAPLALFLPVEATVLDRPFLRTMTTRAVLFGSVLCTPTPEGYEALDRLLQAYNNAMKGRVLFSEMRNLSDLSHAQPVLEKNGMMFEGHLNFLIDLSQPTEQIWKAVRSNAKRNVRKARKLGVTLDWVEDLDGIAAAYPPMKQVYKRLQVPIPDQSLFEAAFDVLYPKNMFKVMLAKVAGEVMGALTLLMHKGVLTYWYTGVPRAGSEYRVSDFLVWEALEYGSENGFHLFDFGGGGKPEEEYGVRDFKAKYGGCLVNYGRNIGVHAPLRLKASEVGYQLLRKYL